MKTPQPTSPLPFTHLPAEDVSAASIASTTVRRRGAPHVREARVVYRPTRRALRQIAVDEPISSPGAVAAALCQLTADSPVEVFGVMTLTTKHHPIRFYEMSVGTLDASLVHPREVFRAAILDNAASIIATHNHPSGDPAPSAEDMAVTRRLCEAGLVLGVTLLDHIVTGEAGRYYSFREAGRI